MEDAEEKAVSERTVAFLRTAAALSACPNLVADLRIASREYGHSGRVANSRLRSCGRCATILTANQLDARFRKPKTKKSCVVTLECGFCNRRLVRSTLRREDARPKAADRLEADASGGIPNCGRKIEAERAGKRPSAPPQTPAGIRRNKKLRANTLQKLADLAAAGGEPNGNQAGVSLLSFMTSLKR
ncbi:hypothetical protein M3Y99_00093400 [Aphelenchoides fujianensis]|nr:hypothetical protein M3Y99_00093400 [Aphelenchoides fujianensis]